MKYLALILIMTASAQADYCQQWGENVSHNATLMRNGETRYSLMQAAKKKGMKKKQRHGYNVALQVAEALNADGYRGRSTIEAATKFCRQTAQ